MASGCVRPLALHAFSAAFLFGSAAVLVFGLVFGAPSLAESKPLKKAPGATPAVKPVATQESYRELILKAQNLTLQHDRLQTSQVLLRAIQRESRSSVAYKELTRALDELTSVFYTERAQSTFVAGESAMDARPKEALDSFQESLRIEDGNLTVLKSLARTYLVLGECDHAETHVKAAEALNPYSSEVVLLRLQVLDCSKNSSALALKLASPEPELEAVIKFAHGIELRDLARRKEWKKARALIGAWETRAADYPEVYFWKWEISRQSGGPADRGAAVKYVQLCQNLTARKRKSFNLDVDLCKGKEAADAYLKETALQPTSPAHQESRDEN